MLPDFKITCLPNNQISLTLQNVIKKSKTYEKLGSVRTLSDNTITRFVRREADKNSPNTLYSHALKHECLSPPLAIISGFQHAIGDFCPIKKPEKKKKLGYGELPSIKYFSARSGQKIREAGGAIDILCKGKSEKCRVITLTLPSSESLAFDALSRYSGYAINRIFQIIRRDYADTYWFFVAEHQKRGAIHFHICILPSNPELGEQIGNEIGKKWYEVLKSISEKSGVDMLFARGFNRRIGFGEGHFYNQPMRKSCGGYFSKYASKNSGKWKDDINSRNARRYPVSSFWGRSRNLKKICDEYSYRFSYEGIDDNDSEYLQDKALRLLSQFNSIQSSSFAFNKEIEIPRSYGGGKLTICEGFTQVFYFQQSDYLKIMEILKNEFNIYKSSRTLALRRNL